MHAANGVKSVRWKHVPTGEVRSGAWVRDIPGTSLVVVVREGQLHESVVHVDNILQGDQSA